MSKPSFTQSLSGRLLLLGVIPAMLAIAAIVAWSALDGYRSVQRAEEQILEAEAEGAASELSARNGRWNNIAEIMAASQTSGLFGHRKESSDFARAVTSSTTLILSSYFVYEPNADGQDAAALKAGDTSREGLDDSGRFVPVWYHELDAGLPTGQCKLKPSVGMDTLDYYTVPKAAFNKDSTPVATITEPYIKEGGLIVSHVFPIVMQKKFVGVAGVNRSLSVLAEITEAIKKRTLADVFILSPGGQFIAATSDTAPRGSGSDALKLRRVSDTPYSSIAPRWQSATAGGDAVVFEAQDPVLNTTCIYATQRTLIGGWTIAVRRAKAEVMRDAMTSVVRNVILGSLGMIVIGGLMFFVSRGITGRVRAAAGAADRIARGDLTQPITQSTSPDETGQLMRSMHTMDANLNSLVGNVKQAGIRLNSTATEIAATSKQQEASTATFGAASNQIAAAVKEISATGHELVRTMESVNRMAAETADLATAGQAGLKGMELVMRDLDGATTSIADKLNAINDRSQKINTVITTITKVADQTNILSINAAIEAEKAGEFGAGFLVIAREIRRLADQTAGATLDIEQMVQQMQGAVSSGVMEMDRFSDQVRRGVREVASAGTQLTEIIDRVNRSTDSFKQVNESMQAQSEGAEQISDAMVSLVGNANQTVQSVQEFSRAASDLQSAIGLLREAVSQFKLRG